VSFETAAEINKINRLKVSEICLKTEFTSPISGALCPAGMADGSAMPLGGRNRKCQSRNNIG